jgi:AcrR family transcriptional regulator
MTSSRVVSPRWLELGAQQRAAVAETVVDLVAETTTGPSVAEIAERAGMSRPTFYKYFPTLGAAMLHTAESLLSEIEQHVASLIPADANARERLLARFATSFDYSCAHPKVVRFFTYYDFTFRSAGFEADEQEIRGAISHNAGDPYLDLFREGRHDGSIEPSLPEDVTYLAMVSSLVGTSQRLMIESKWTTGSDERARAVYAMLLDVWREALRPANA